MQIKTRFSAGDTIYTIAPKTFKAMTMTVAVVSTYTRGGNETSVTYYDDEMKNNVPQDMAFANLDELTAYVRDVE